MSDDKSSFLAIEEKHDDPALNDLDPPPST